MHIIMLVTIFFIIILIRTFKIKATYNLCDYIDTWKSIKKYQIFTYEKDVYSDIN